MEYFTEYIKPELLILIPVLYLIGIGLKHTTWISDKLIPLLLGIAGIVLAVIYTLASDVFSSAQTVATAIFTAITQGILTAGASVYANQIFRQLKGGSENDTEH